MELVLRSAGLNRNAAKPDGAASLLSALQRDHDGSVSKLFDSSHEGAGLMKEIGSLLGGAKS